MKTKELPASHFIPYDEEERELAEMIENWELDYENWEKDEMIVKMIENYKKTQEKKTISIRLRNSSLQSIKKFAKKQKIPYQTLINMQIDKFAESIKS